MKNQFQQLTETQRNELLILLQKFKDLCDGTLSTWIIYQVYFELKEYVEPIGSRPYPVTKVHDEM